MARRMAFCCLVIACADGFNEPEIGSDVVSIRTSKDLGNNSKRLQVDEVENVLWVSLI
jgi:hypothetical protein